MLFSPSNITPDASYGIGNGTVDANTDLVISWQVNGNSALTAYSVEIFQNNSSSTSLYSTGKLTDGCPFYGTNYAGETQFFQFAIASSTLSSAGIVNGNEYKFVITQWWSDTESVVQPSASVFITRSAPQVLVNTVPQTISTRSYTFTATYTQAQGDALNWVRWMIAEQDDLNNPLYDTGEIYGTAELAVVYDGFFTGRSYAVCCDIQTVNGVNAQSGWTMFDVSYPAETLSGFVSASIACGKSAVSVSWPGIFVTQGEATGNYTLDNGSLILPFGSYVSWSEQNGTPISYAAPWSILTRATLNYSDAQIVSIAIDGQTTPVVLQYSFLEQTLSLVQGSTTLATLPGVYGTATISAILTSDTLYLRTDTLKGGLHPSSALYPDTTVYPQADTVPTVDTQTITVSYTQGNITNIAVSGALVSHFIEVQAGTVSSDIVSEFITNATYVPSITTSTYFLADFIDGLDAGNLSIGGDEVLGFAVYRQQDGAGQLVHVADVPINTAELMDYGACSMQGNYTYYVFPIGSNTFITAPIVSNAINPCFWSWSLLSCTQDDNGIYNVEQEFLFSNNVSTSEISNNNSPSVFATFTRFPLIQLSPSLYKSGTLSGLIGTVDYANANQYSDTIAMRDQLFELSTTPNTIFLKSRKGDLIQIKIGSAMSVSTNDNSTAQEQTMSVPWIEVADSGGASVVSIIATQEDAQ